MANITVLYWKSSAVSPGMDLPYPAEGPPLTLSSPGSLLVPPGVHVIVITSDTDTRVTFDGSAVTSGSMPIMAAVPNQFAISGPPTGVTLTFQ